MEVIRDKAGNIIGRSRNLAGIRRYTSNHLIKQMDLSAIGENGSEGQLSILFDDGVSFQTNFCSLQVLKNFVRNWRNVYGAPLLVNGQDCGKVDYHNPNLIG